MKIFNALTFLGIFGLLTATVAVAGAGSSGGGDPLEISAQPYPDQAQLASAIDLAKEKITAAPYAGEFKQKLAQEIDSLAATGQYKYLPALIIIGRAEGVEGYPLPQDLDRFLSLGGMTRLSPGASVFFTERVTHYSFDQFAELVIHEAIHHIVSRALSEDEEFVEDLTRSITEGHATNALELAIKYGVYISSRGKILGSQFAEALLKAGFLNYSICHLYLDGCHYQSLQDQVFHSVGQHLGKDDVSNLPLDDLISRLAKSIGSATRETTLDELRSIRLTLTGEILRYALTLDPSNELAKRGEFTCKKTDGFFAGFFGICSDEDRVRVKDFFRVPEQNPQLNESN